MSEISQYTESLHEECGVFGMYDKTGETDMVSAVYSALYALQHRGQESCGIALNVDGVLTGYRDLGLVSEVFTKRVLEELPRGAKMATGHVRYATAGQRSRSNAQPMVLHHCKGAMAVCHNGNLVNAPKLRRKLEMSGSIFHGTSDTEVIAYLLTQNRLLTPNIEMAVSRTMDDIEGAYSLVIMTHTKLIAARDPNGFRPLCIGELPDGNGYAFASESCALDAVGAKFVRDVRPGETTTACARWRTTAAPRRTRCASLSTSTLPARIPSSRALVCMRPVCRQAGSWRRSIPWRPMSSSAHRTLVWMQRSAMRRRAASPTAWALSRTNM